MSNEQYVVGNADVTGTAFNVPGAVSSDTSFTVEPDPYVGDTGRHWYVHVENGFNENVDVTVQGTHHLDESMSAPADDGNTETINAGANGVFDGETGHSYIRVNVAPAADPTSGELTVTFQSREE